MDEPSLIGRFRWRASRILIGLRIWLHRVYRRTGGLRTDTGRLFLRMAIRFSQIGRLAGWVRRHPGWATLELVGLLLAIVFGLPSVSQHIDSVDVEETALRFDDVEIHEESGGGFAEHEFHSPSPPEVVLSRTSTSHLAGSSPSGGPLLVPDPPANPMPRGRTARFQPVTTSSSASSSATRSASRFVRAFQRTDGKQGAWLTGTIESVEPAVRMAGRTEFNPMRRQ